MLTKPQKARMRCRFEAWKMQLDKKPPLDKYKNGRYQHHGIQREFAAYMHGIAKTLPDDAPKYVLEAIIGAGVKPHWANDVYNAVRTALLEREAK